MRRLAPIPLIFAAALAPPAASAAATPPPPAPAPAAPPSVSLTITAGSPRQPWRMRVVNAGAVPVRLTADARLLSFELTAPNVRTPLRCALPADMRPSNDIDRALVLPPHRSYSETFEPRLYCFGAREAAALAPGTTVVAHLGWPTPAPPRGRAGAHAAPPHLAPPFEVSPLDGVMPATSPLKELVAAPFTIPPEPAPPAPPQAAPPPRAPAEPFPTRLTLSVPARVESWNPYEAAVSVTVKNEGSRPVTFLFRPETVGFDVIGPDGSDRCVWPTSPGAPIREMYTTLPPGGRATRSVLLSTLCTGNTLDQGGLFIVRPRLDTRAAGGAPIGLRTFDGEVMGQTTTILRLHRGKEPPRMERPRLDPP